MMFNSQIVIDKIYALEIWDEYAKDIIEIVTSHAGGQTVTLASHLKYDLGFNSLSMVELCVAIEDAFDITIDERMFTAEKVQDICELVVESKNDRTPKVYNIEKFPIQKTRRQIRVLKIVMNISRTVWRLEVSGLENIPINANYILCPNHQSRLDIMMAWTAVGPKIFDLTKICCLVAQELLTHPVFKRFMVLFGGIPTDRHTNPVPAFKRCLDCLRSGFNVLIHPEGTVTKDGYMNEFKGGAAKLAIDADVDIIPMRIEGTRTIWRLYTLFPKILDWRRMRRYKVTVSFGEAISPKKKSVEEITALIRKSVEELGNNQYSQ